MPDSLIEVPGSQFRRAYLLYVIEVSHGQEKYFYVGQTGDNKYLTARPAIRRLFGHLEDRGQSTQNQAYRYIATRVLDHKTAQNKTPFSEELKQGVEDFLASSVVRMHIYKAESFNPRASREAHLAVVRKLSALEKHVAAAFAGSGKNLMNRIPTTSPTAACPYPNVLARVKSDFGLVTI